MWADPTIKVAFSTALRTVEARRNTSSESLPSMDLGQCHVLTRGPVQTDPWKSPGGAYNIVARLRSSSSLTTNLAWPGQLAFLGTGLLLSRLS